MTTKDKKPKKKMSRSAIVLIVCLCIIIIPLLVYGGILLSAQLSTGTPVLGDRFKGDLDPAIQDSELQSLKDEMTAMSDVESVDIELKTGQVRINVDVKDSLTLAQIESLIDSLYLKVDQKLPIKTYFTSSSGKRMYDLSINVYNFVNGDSDQMIYVILTKNSMMESYSEQVVSEPLNSELAAELRGETLPSEEEEPTEPAE